MLVVANIIRHIREGGLCRECFSMNCFSGVTEVELKICITGNPALALDKKRLAKWPKKLLYL